MTAKQLGLELMGIYPETKIYIQKPGEDKVLEEVTGMARVELLNSANQLEQVLLLKSASYADGVNSAILYTE